MLDCIVICETEGTVTANGLKCRKVLVECPKCSEQRIAWKSNAYKSTYCRSCSVSRTKYVHGCKPKRLYDIWKNMRNRCNNTDAYYYHRYGGRGVSVCEEWNDFEAFRNWAITGGYSCKLQIDRIDNNGNYEPSNCRFTTSSVNAANRNLGTANNSGYIGVHSRPNNKWRAQIVSRHKKILSKTFNCITSAVVARDAYIVDNNLPHTLNLTGNN